MGKTAKEIAEIAADLVSGERDRQHGAKVPNHKNIARLWRSYLRNKAGSPTVFTYIDAKDVALMMVLLKVARTQLGEHNLDDYLDMAGYAACAGEIADTTEGVPE